MPKGYWCTESIHIDCKQWSTWTGKYIHSTIQWDLLHGSSVHDDDNQYPSTEQHITVTSTILACHYDRLEKWNILFQLVHPQTKLTKGKDVHQLAPETHTWLMKCRTNFSRFTAVGLATWLKLWCVHTKDCGWWWKKVPIWVILPVPHSSTVLDI